MSKAKRIKRVLREAEKKAMEGDANAAHALTAIAAQIKQR